MKSSIALILITILASCSTSEEAMKPQSNKIAKINLKHLDFINADSQPIDLLIHEIPAHK